MKVVGGPWAISLPELLVDGLTSVGPGHFHQSHVCNVVTKRGEAVVGRLGGHCESVDCLQTEVGALTLGSVC